MQFNLIETDTGEQFLKEATNLLEKEIGGILAKTGRCVLCLAGGKTPLPIYQELAKRPLDWKNVWIFLSDERYVAPDHADSNQRAIREALITPIGLPPEQFLAPDTWKPLEECVHLYEESVKALLAKGQPDIAVLGMGQDGHIASLFPPVPPEAMEPSVLAIATHTENFPVPDRITVTFPVLSSAVLPILLLQGRLKRRTWTQMMESPADPSLWPGLTLLTTGRATVIAEWPTTKEA